MYSTLYVKLLNKNQYYIDFSTVEVKDEYSCKLLKQSPKLRHVIRKILWAPYEIIIWSDTTIYSRSDWQGMRLLANLYVNIGLDIYSPCYFSPQGNLTIWVDLAHRAPLRSGKLQYYHLDNVWHLSFLYKVRKSHVQQTSLWIRSMKIATQKGDVDNRTQ